MMIEKFTVNEVREYNSLEDKLIRDSLYELSERMIRDYITVYLLICKTKFLKRKKVIGRCIIFDFKKVENEHRNYWCAQYRIPSELNYNEFFVEDFYILKEYRNRGYGKFFAKEIMNEYKNNQLMLEADGDGRWFWPKMGFKLIDEDYDIYVFSEHMLSINEDIKCDN